MTDVATLRYATLRYDTPLFMYFVFRISYFVFRISYFIKLIKDITL
jgi:hypothetical protein